MWAWGDNSHGQVGDNTSGNTRASPVRVKDDLGLSDLKGIVALAAGSAHSLALGSDGKAWAWGLNDDGQAGAGFLGDILLPTRVLDESGFNDLVGITSVAAGSFNSYAVTKGGAAWAWGRDDHGQLGDGTAQPYWPLPERVKDVAGSGMLTDVVAVEGGTNHVLAISAPVEAGIASPPLTNSRDVPVTVSGTSGWPVDAYYASAVATPPDPSAAGWSDSPQLTVHVSAGDGAKTIYGFARNAGGIVSPAATATVTLDTVPPTAQLSLPRVTGKPLVTLTAISGADSNGIAGYYLSELPFVPTPTSGGWKSAKPATFLLSEDAGLHTVFLWTKDAARNISDPVAAKTLLDGTLPTTTLGLPEATRTRAVRTAVSASDVNGIAGYFLSESPATPAANAPGWLPAAPSTFTLADREGAHTVYLWAKDTATSISRVAVSRTVLDRKVPVVAIRVPKPGAQLDELTGIRGVTSDPAPSAGRASASYALRWKQGSRCKWWNGSAGRLVSGACTKPLWYTLPVTAKWFQGLGKVEIPGAYVLYVQAADKAGNVGKAQRPFVIK